MKKLLILGTILATTMQTMMAVQARRDVVHQIIQPDGTTLSAKLVGDEYAHCYVTIDNIPLALDNNGNYCYATLSADGKAVASSHIARNIADRTNSDIKFVSTLNGQAICTAMLNNLAQHAPSRANQSSGIGLKKALFPHTGDVNTLVLLVEYSDIKFVTPNAAEYYEDFLNGEHFTKDNATGSCREYFINSSTGQFRPTFDMYGPVTLPNKRSYYGGNDFNGNDKNVGEMIYDACRLLDDQIDYSKYDLDDDGYVDNIYVIYAGQGEASGGPSESVWPHQWDLSSAYGKTPEFDGKYVNHYGCCNEYDQIRPAGIGTFCHEFGHVMGLPDLYAINYGAAITMTPGSWDIMDYGTYNNDTRTPPAYSAYERNAMGWIDLKELNKSESIALQNLHDTNSACIINTDKDNEFFLLENRQQTGWDEYLPGHGMLIWHIDYKKNVWETNTVNDRSNHQYIDIEEASGVSNNQDDKILAGYAFPGTSGATAFTDDTKPSMRTWEGKALETPIENIIEDDGIIFFDVCGGDIELGRPTITASNVTAGGFTINWTKIDQALSYIVNICIIDGDRRTPLKGYDNLETEATSLTIDRLDCDTRLQIEVTPKRGRLLGSNIGELEVVTSAFDFTLAIPKTLPAEDINDSEFTAKWLTVKDAADYQLTVIAHKEIAGDDCGCDFGTNTMITLPEGWTTNCKDSYSSDAYCGKARPSLKMMNKGSYILSPVFDQDVIGVEFWMRSAGGSASNYIEVSCYVPTQGSTPDDKNNWHLLLSHNNIVTTSGGETIKLDNEIIPLGARQIRIEYFKTAAGNLALDDVIINTGRKEDMVLPDYNNRSVGNTTSHRVSGLEGGRTTYTYTVTAISTDGKHSLISDGIDVVLDSDSNSSVSDITTNVDAPIEYYNLQGLRIAQPTTPGIYIRQQGHNTEKIIIR